MSNSSTDWKRTLAFVGGRAILHRYSVTHSHTVIELEMGEERCYLVFYECSRLKMPTSWRYELPEILVTDEPEWFVVRANGGEVEIEFMWFEIRPDKVPK